MERKATALIPLVVQTQACLVATVSHFPLGISIRSLPPSILSSVLRHSLLLPAAAQSVSIEGGSSLGRAQQPLPEPASHP